MGDRLQALVPHARRDALRSSDDHRCGEPLPDRGADRGADLGRRAEGRWSGFSRRSACPTRSAPTTERLRLDGSGRPLGAVGVVAQARHRAALHPAVEPAGQRQARSHALHAEGADLASSRGTTASPRETFVFNLHCTSPRPSPHPRPLPVKGRGGADRAHPTYGDSPPASVGTSSAAKPKWRSQRRSAENMSRRSGMPYFSMAMRSRPMPNAKP